MEDTNKFKELLTKIAPLTDEEWNEVLPLFHYKHIEKGDYFLKKGSICTQLAFVCSGVMRSFVEVNDREISIFFQLESNFAVAMLSFLTQKPAIESIQAIKNTLVLYIRREDLYNLYNGNWKWQQIGRVLTEQYYIMMEQRMIMLQSNKANEKYEFIVQKYPQIIQQVPLQYIASFLGISPETLSRIRSRYGH